MFYSDSLSLFCCRSYISIAAAVTIPAIKPVTWAAILT